VVFGVTGVRPIPAIILAQAFNGILLPLIAVFLWLTMNDRKLLGDGVNTRVQNIAMGVVVAVCVVLGLRGLLAAGTGVLAFFSG
jgi:Mn2+/Fe2+ NRAMP family transporter